MIYHISMKESPDKDVIYPSGVTCSYKVPRGQLVYTPIITIYLLNPSFWSYIIYTNLAIIKSHLNPHVEWLNHLKSPFSEPFFMGKLQFSYHNSHRYIPMYIYIYTVCIYTIDPTFSWWHHNVSHVSRRNPEIPGQLQSFRGPLLRGFTRGFGDRGGAVASVWSPWSMIYMGET